MSPPKEETYGRHMAHFMNFLYDRNDNFTQQYTDEELSIITPEDIIKFFKFKAFKINEDRPINEAVDRCTGCRGSTIDAYKRSLSHFMPNRIPAWDRIHKTGNPTKSAHVNDFIKLIKKLEVNNNLKAT